ncbi:hypothetical protein JYU16_00985 [bacterium AH-315-M05]|nr:hypothetical protein [bacterium AH-315-M05]
MKMNKFIATIIIVSINLIHAKSQDLIITDKGDSLNCKIMKIRGAHFHITFKDEDKIRRAVLPSSMVKYYQKEYYHTREKVKDTIVVLDDNPMIRFSISGGLSNLVAKISDQIPSDFIPYMKELRSGYHIGGDLNYYITGTQGIGIKYSMFRTKNQLNNIYIIYPNGQTRSGILRDDITIQFIGPSYCMRMFLGNKYSHLISNISLGYLDYRNNAKLIDDFILSSSALGFSGDIGIDFLIDNNISLGIAFSITLGTLSKFEIDDGVSIQTIELDKENFENISRIDLSIGLKYYK